VRHARLGGDQLGIIVYERNAKVLVRLQPSATGMRSRR
jgi:hypothetical protein